MGQVTWRSGGCLILIVVLLKTIASLQVQVDYYQKVQVQKIIVRVQVHQKIIPKVAQVRTTQKAQVHQETTQMELVAVCITKLSLTTMLISLFNKAF